MLQHFAQAFMEVLGHSLSAVALIVVGFLVRWLFDVYKQRDNTALANRLAEQLERRKSELAGDLEESKQALTAELERFRAVVSREEQFHARQVERHSELWASLCELDAAADEMFSGNIEYGAPPQQHVAAFYAMIQQTELAVHKGSLLLTEQQYFDLRIVLQEIESFCGQVEDATWSQALTYRQQYSTLVEQIRQDFRHQIWPQPACIPNHSAGAPAPAEASPEA